MNVHLTQQLQLEGRGRIPCDYPFRYEDAGLVEEFYQIQSHDYRSYSQASSLPYESET